jgi:hypothetical protein
MIDIDELERLEKAATPGEWTLDWDWFDLGVDDRKYTAYSYTPTVWGKDLRTATDKCNMDRDFIEALRNNAREMIAELRRLRAELERYHNPIVIVPESEGEE